jgi:hypothetical protein
VDAFFGLLKSELQKVKSDPTRTHNVDETEISIVQRHKNKCSQRKRKEASSQIAFG